MRYPLESRLGPALATLLLTALTTGCLSGQAAVSSPAPDPTPSLRAKSEHRGPVVEQTEIRSMERGLTAFEAIRRLRPEFLNRHSAPTPGDVEAGFAVVYLDGMRLGGLETLESLSVTTIARIRYLRPAAAVAELGKTHRGGVILVSTVR